MTVSLWISVAVLVLLALFLIACGSSTVITTLETVVSAAEAAVPIIGAAAGLPPATSAMIISYLEAVSAAASQASTILASTATTAEKTAEIIAAFAKVTAGLALPVGTPAEIVAVINAVAQAVVNFLANFPPAATKTPAIPISKANQAKLSSLKARSETVSTKLKGVKR